MYLEILTIPLPRRGGWHRLGHCLGLGTPRTVLAGCSLHRSLHQSTSLENKSWLLPDKVAVPVDGLCSGQELRQGRTPQ